MLRNEKTQLRAALFFVVAVALIGHTAGSFAVEQAPAVQEYQSTDVVVLSLASLNDASAEQRRRVGEILDEDEDTDVSDFMALFKVQLAILRETATFGPVLLVAPDDATKNYVYQNCREFQICDLFKSDRLRMKVVPHSGPWVRDFGPEIDLISGQARVVHWRYFDNRMEEARSAQLEKLEAQLASLLKAKVAILDKKASVLAEMSSSAQQQALSQIDSHIEVIRDYIQYVRETSGQRRSDEASAFNFADAVLQEPGFNYASSELSVDGGNLLKLDNGRCLTTRTLLARNKDTHRDVQKELREVAGCVDVILLDPLPGSGVIEHADMFVLPVQGKRILLASYDPSNPLASAHWKNELSSAEQYLSMSAALTMERNADRLTRLGYEVIRVQAPFPRIGLDQTTYYPTVLNALVRSGKNGRRQVLLPSYDGYEEDVQAAAFDQIQNAFGPNTEFSQIESTATAKGQGAIHCLTITVPLSVSIFNDPNEQVQKTQYLALKEQVDEEKNRLLAQLPDTGEQGLWTILDENQQITQGRTGSGPRKIHFGNDQFEFAVVDHVLVRGHYEIVKREKLSWSLVFKYEDGDTDTALLQWQTRDQAKLTFGDEPKSVVLKRIDSDAGMPFEMDDDGDRDNSSAQTRSDNRQMHHKKRVPNRTARSG